MFDLLQLAVVQCIFRGTFLQLAPAECILILDLLSWLQHSAFLRGSFCSWFQHSAYLCWIFCSWLQHSTFLGGLSAIGSNAGNFGGPFFSWLQHSAFYGDLSAVGSSTVQTYVGPSSAGSSTVYHYSLEAFQKLIPEKCLIGMTFLVSQSRCIIGGLHFYWSASQCIIERLFGSWMYSIVGIFSMAPTLCVLLTTGGGGGGRLRQPGPFRKHASKRDETLKSDQDIFLSPKIYWRVSRSPACWRKGRILQLVVENTYCKSV